MIKFNDAQQLIIDLKEGWHACQAPAGSGKTEVLTERVRQALESGHDPHKMLCITFTNRAARSMIERTSTRLGENANDVFIGNTHAYALKLLQENRCLPQTSALIETSTESDIWRFALYRVEAYLNDISDQTVQTELEPYFGRLDSLIEPPARLDSSDIANAFSAIKKLSWGAWNIRSIASLLKVLIDPRISIKNSSLHEHTKSRLKVIDPNIPNDQLPLACAISLMIQEQYERIKNSLSLYDFDDLLVLAYRELTSMKPLKMVNFTWVQIDEAQDLSPIQWLILKASLAPNAHVLLLGDLGQSIYRFLGASIEVTQYEFGSSVHTLRKNYRSPANLVEAANVYRSFFFKDSFQSVAACPENPNAMILVNRDHESEVRDKLIRHAIGLMQKYDNVSVAFLFPSNKGVKEFSNFLKNSGVEHFKVGSNDLFSKVEALDFIAFLSALYNPKSRLAWSRLFYRFGDLSRLSSGDRDNYSPLLASADLAAKLGRLGSELKDFLYGDVEQHYLVQFVAHAKGKVTYFDTETTGLSYNQDAIIQLAGVKVDNGSVNEEIDLYCRTDIPLGDSVKVHHITEEVLDKYGQSIDQQLNRFLEFNNLRPLVAHNLPFDDNMLRSHLKKFLPLSYATYEALPKYCTLDLARRFYPSLSNHKLGCLLEYFELDGVNSHNAIDDVKAGSALMTKLVDDAESKLPEITQLIEPYTDALQRFSDLFSPLYNEATSMINEEKVVSIKELLDLYFSYIEELPGAKYDKVSLTEFSQKIIRHADENFKPAHFRNYLDQVMPFYQTAKEPDLITKSDRLVVSTIHRSKGLEFDCVLIPSAIEDVLPSFFVKKQLDSLPSELRNEANSLLQEQARLFYVAFTRAKRQVVVGSYNIQKGYSKSLTRFMSPILKYFRNL